MSLEREVFLLGIWKNFEQIEEELTLEELEEILTAARDQEHRQFKFFAALKGIDIDEGQVPEGAKSIQDVWNEVVAEETGKSKELVQMEKDFTDIGFSVELVEE